MITVENKLGALCHRAINILHRHGLFAFIKGAVLYLIANGLAFEQIVLVSNDLAILPDIQLKLEGMELKRITRFEEIDALVAQGYTFDKYDTFFRDRDTLKETIANGAMLFAVFLNREFVSMSWATFSDKAKRGIDNLPYKVDFEHGESCHGGTETIPQYRNLGIFSYNLCLMLKYLKERGSKLDRSAQIGNRKRHSRHIERYGAEIYGYGIRIKILVWSFWKEHYLVKQK
jgi:hypothetical protein